MEVYKPKTSFTYDEEEERERRTNTGFFIRGDSGYIRPVAKRINANEYPCEVVFFEKNGEDPEKYRLIVRFEPYKPYWTMCGEKLYRKYKRPVLKWMAMWWGADWLKRYKAYEKEQAAKKKARRKAGRQK